MTVSVTNAFTSATGNGSTTVFPFTFSAGSTAEVAVTVGGILQNSGFTVTLNAGNNGGSVTFTTPPAAGAAILMASAPLFTQPITFLNAGAYNPQTVDNVNDEAARRSIYLKSFTDRAVVVPLGEAGLTLPPLASRANRVAAFDGTGKFYVPSVAASDLDILAGIASSIAAVALISTNVTAVAGDLSNVNTVAADRANIDAVAGDLPSINTLVGDLTNVNTVAGAVANVNLVGPSIAGVNTVAMNIGAVNTCAANIAAIVDAPNQAAAAAASAALAAGYAGAISITALPGYAGGFKDGRGRYFMVVRLSGSALFGSLEAYNANLSNLTAGGSTFKQKAPYGYSYGWGDASGRFSVGVRNDGALSATKLVNVKTINGVDTAGLVGPYASQKPVLDADINGFCIDGQSKGTGLNSQPVLTTAALYDGLRYSDGVRVYDTATPLRNSLVPLIETVNGSMGETPASGMEATIKQRLLVENGIAYTDRPYQMLMTVEARQGYAISQLAVGSVPQLAIRSDIAAMQTLAQAAGLTSKFRGFGWSQGEADYTANTTAASYRSQLTAIRADLDTYAKSLNPKNGDVICFIDQVFAHASYSHPNDPYLALEQLAISEDTPNFVMVGNFAHLPNAGYPHWTNQASQWAGAYYGRAYKRVIVEKGTWLPLKPVDWWRDGNIVMLRFTPESGQLFFDTSTIPAKTNYGFSLVDSGGSAITISSVSLVGKDTVKIVAATAVGAGAHVRGGNADGYTNLRDTMGDTIKAAIGTNVYRLDNWCVIFDKTLT